MLTRRDLLKSGVIGVAGAMAEPVFGQQEGPFEGATAHFDKAHQEQLPAFAFKKRLVIPLTPRPTQMGWYDELEGAEHVFGPADKDPIGACFHGVALEWGATPKHWTLYGCTPNDGSSKEKRREAWEDKREKFGTIPNHIAGGKPIQNWGHFPIKCYKLPLVSKLVDLVPGLPPTRVYGYGGMVPGPTLRLRHGQPIVVRYENHLETEVSVHLHGAHTPSHSDGFPTFYVLQGKSRDYFYPNFVPLKLVEKQPDGSFTHEPDVSECQSTMWYHDHGMDATGYNVSKGLAGFALFFSEAELKLIADGILPGLGEESCQDPEPDQFLAGAAAKDIEDKDNPGFYAPGREPYHNPYDLPLVLQDKVIDSKTGQIAFTTDAHNGYLGDTFFVNGVPWPFYEVENRKYRLRLLNGSNSRVYHLRILSEQAFQQSQLAGLSQQELVDAAQPFLRIGKDSWLWPEAMLKHDLVLAMANRADLVVDFKKLAPNLKQGETASFYLVNTMPQFDGRGPKEPLADPGDPRVLPLPFAHDGNLVAELRKPIALMRFDVQGPPVQNDAKVEDKTCLIKREPIRDDEVKVVRQFIFHRGKGAWQINSRFYDPTISNASPKINAAEEWVLRNGGGGWWHPIHIHVESHQIVKYEKDFAADENIDPADAPPLNKLNQLVDVTQSIDRMELLGYHDTQILGPNTAVRIRLRFRTFHGPFVFHCHNLEHEDMRMMVNMEPKPHLPDPITGDTDLPNVAPDARTHGNLMTLNGWSEDNPAGAFGELPWEFPPVPQSPVNDAGNGTIPAARSD